MKQSLGARLGAFSLNPYRNIRGVAEFREAMRDVAGVQEKVLLRIVRKNGNTLYGRKHSFNKINSISDYQKYVPVISYEDILPEINRLKAGKQNILTKDRVIYFATTSGTTKNVKLIPVTKERTRIFRTELLLWMTFFLRKNKGVLRGKTLYFAGPAHEFYTKAGIPCGSISGYLAGRTPWFARQRLAVPPKTYDVMDFDAKTKRIALYALQSNITQIGFASPIEALLFFDYLEDNRGSLTAELKKKGRNARARELEELGDFRPVRLWPSLALISCIKSKPNQMYLDVLRRKIGNKKIKVRDPGIYSSEGRLSLCIEDDGRAAGVIPAHENFFEFWEQKKGVNVGAPVTADKVVKGKEYLVIITTPEGLYRYDMGDIVRVVGFKGELPIITFVNRANYLNVAGELAHENMLIESMRFALKRTGVKLRGFTFLPLLVPAKKPRYEILAEPFGALPDAAAKRLLYNIDRSLQENISDYRQMRNEFGRMDSPVLSVLKKGSYDALERKRLVRGGQPKPIYMSKDGGFRENFSVERKYG